MNFKDVFELREGELWVKAFTDKRGKFREAHKYYGGEQIRVFRNGKLERYGYYNRVLYELHYGPIPEGYKVVSTSRDKMPKIENLVLKEMPSVIKRKKLLTEEFHKCIIKDGNQYILVFKASGSRCCLGVFKEKRHAEDALMLAQALRDEGYRTDYIKKEVKSLCKEKLITETIKQTVKRRVLIWK